MKKLLTVVIVSLVCTLILSACFHEHTWRDATCSAPVFCEGCGQTQGEPLAHSWQDATCTEPKTCTSCAVTEGSAAGHQWADATCLTAKTCTVCAETEGKALDHAVETWTTVTEATCQEAGLESGSCLRCQETVEKELEKLAHTPGEWEVSVKATVSGKGQRTKNCTICKETLEQEEYELSEGEYEQAYKDACEKYKFSEIARAPGQYKGKLAKFTGEVIQVQQDTLLGIMFYTLRVNVTKKGSYYSYYTDTIYVTYTTTEDAPRILEDDIVTMYGELQGEKTYTTVMGASMTIPAFEAEYIDIK